MKFINFLCSVWSCTTLTLVNSCVPTTQFLEKLTKYLTRRYNDIPNISNYYFILLIRDTLPSLLVCGVKRARA